MKACCRIQQGEETCTEMCFSCDAHGPLSYNAALLNKTVCYWHLVFECELPQPPPPPSPPSSLYSCTEWMYWTTKILPYVSMKLCTKLIGLQSNTKQHILHKFLVTKPIINIYSSIFRSNGVQISPWWWRCNTKTLKHPENITIFPKWWLIIFGWYFLFTIAWMSILMFQLRHIKRI